MSGDGEEAAAYLCCRYPFWGRILHAGWSPSGQACLKHGTYQKLRNSCLHASSRAGEGLLEVLHGFLMVKPRIKGIYSIHRKEGRQGSIRCFVRGACRLCFYASQRTGREGRGRGIPKSILVSHWCLGYEKRIKNRTADSAQAWLKSRAEGLETASRLISSIRLRRTLNGH